MSDRQRVRVGRDVTYQPTDAEASTGGGDAGDLWPAKITDVLPTGNVNLFVHEADGGFISKTNVAQGTGKGFFALSGLSSHV